MGAGQRRSPAQEQPYNEVVESGRPIALLIPSSRSSVDVDPELLEATPAAIVGHGEASAGEGCLDVGELPRVIPPEFASVNSVRFISARDVVVPYNL